MLRFAETFPNFEIVQTLSGQLGWSHVIHLIAVSDALAREFYARMCITERWSARTQPAEDPGDALRADRDLPKAGRSWR
jgi:hypothetical protein